MSSNDNDQNYCEPAAMAGAGGAALLLVESLIHGLCENGTLSIGEAMAIADRAADVQHDHAVAADGAGAPMWHAHALLMGIKSSLSTDGGDATPAG